MSFDDKRRTNALLLERARAMRHDLAPAEKKLWAFLRDRQLGGFKFRRQHRIALYIADFYCHETKLVVELAATHMETEVRTTRGARSESSATGCA